MREPNRLYRFYKELQLIHYKYPDVRFGQLFQNFEKWLLYVKGKDIFYLEEDELLKLFKEYMKED